jgi:aspartyl-tRNA(Asn)/glutamyl-tRNA(Gln) amidotransferase subunit C
MTTFTSEQVSFVATLANIPLKKEEREPLAKGFTTTLEVVDELQKVDVSGVEPVHHVTGLENIWREDVVDEQRMFTQSQALANAPHTYNGYIVVDQVIEQE